MSERRWAIDGTSCDCTITTKTTFNVKFPQGYYTANCDFYLNGDLIGSKKILEEGVNTYTTGLYKDEHTEASSKIGYLTFEQIYSKEVSELIDDLWNQLAIRITINKPASLESEMLQSGEKSQAQTGFQPNDVTAGVGK